MTHPCTRIGLPSIKKSIDQNPGRHDPLGWFLSGQMRVPDELSSGRNSGSCVFRMPHLTWHQFTRGFFQRHGSSCRRHTSSALASAARCTARCTGGAVRRGSDGALFYWGSPERCPQQPTRCEDGPAHGPVSSTRF